MAKPEKPIASEPFIGNRVAVSFAINVDPKWKLSWTNHEIDGDHLIEVLAEGVSDAYLYYLQQKYISYFFTGKETLELKAALHQLATLFSIQTIILEGGGPHQCLFTQ